MSDEATEVYHNIMRTANSELRNIIIDWLQPHGFRPISTNDLFDAAMVYFGPRPLSALYAAMLQEFVSHNTVVFSVAHTGPGGHWELFCSHNPSVVGTDSISVIAARRYKNRDVNTTVEEIDNFIRYQLKEWTQ